MGRIQDNSFGHILTGDVRIVHCHSPLRGVYYGFGSHTQVLKKKGPEGVTIITHLLFTDTAASSIRESEGDTLNVTAILKQDALYLSP